MAALSIITLSLCIFLIVITLIPFSKSSHWLIRGFDFPRLQIAALLLIALGGACGVFPFATLWHYVLNISVAGCAAIQLGQILPYTVLWKKQVKKSTQTPQPDNVITLLASNVYAPNQNVQALLNLIYSKKPDVVLTLETNLWWQEQLKRLKQHYPYSIEIPLENLYGMHLFSKLPLHDVEVKFLTAPNIPSIHCHVQLATGELIELHCLHPMPPSPTESPTSEQRDAELLTVGRNIDTAKGAVIVLGDLNDVAWSSTTKLFQKISGLLDPRKGRGFFNTFHAGYPMFRWPLDHFFHSNHFTLVQLERLPNIGSDHFPMYIALHLDPQEKHKQPTPHATQAEQETANEKIEKY